MTIKRHNNPSDQKNIDSSTRRKLFKRLLIVLVAGVLAIAAIAVETNAWYLKNARVFFSGGRITSDEVTVSVEGYQVMGYEDNGLDSGVRYSFYSDEFNNPPLDSQTGLEPKINMIAFDVIDKHNEYTPVVLRIPVMGSAAAAGDSLDVTLTIDNNSDWIVTSGLKLKDILSNLVEVHCGVLSSQYGTDLQTWNAVVDAFDGNTGSTYVTWSEISPQKSYELHFTVSGYTPPANGQPLNVYLMINYNEELIQKYMVKNKQTVELGTNESKTIFYGDFDMLSVDVSSGN